MNLKDMLNNLNEDEEKEVTEQEAKKIAKLFPAAWKADTKTRLDFEKERGKLATRVDPEEIFYEEDKLVVMSYPAKSSEDDDDDDIAIEVQLEGDTLKIISWWEMT